MARSGSICTNINIKINALQKIADEVIDLLAKAQQSDGYLNTYFTIEAPERRYKRYIKP